MTIVRHALTLVLTLTCLGTTPALAHDFFLIAEPPGLPAPGVSVVAMHVTDKFPGPSSGWRADKVTNLNVHGPAHTTQADMPWPKQDAAGARVRMAAAGSYMVTVDVSASSISIPAQGFDEYLGHEGHDQLLAQRRNAPASDQPVRERYTRFLKTIVTCGQPAASSGAHLSQPTGQRIEIVPLANTSTLKPGQSLPVQVLYQGQPMSGGLLAATHPRHGAPPSPSGQEDDDHSQDHYAFSARTDAQGQVSIPITHAGYQLLRITHMIALPDDDDFDYDSYWASLTFFVAESSTPAKSTAP